MSPRWSILQGDALERLREMPDASFSACLCDPPYGLDLTTWDGEVPGPDLWREVFRVLKPGGWLLAFGGTRLWHRLAVAMEGGGFQVRDTLMWLYGTGNPKALEVAKAIDRKRVDRQEVLQVTAWIRSARDAAGMTNRDLDMALGTKGMAGHWTSPASQPSLPTLDQVPHLLRALGDPEPPGEIARLLLELNGRKGQPGEAWAQREVIGEVMAKDTQAARPLALKFQGLEPSGRRAIQITRAAGPDARRFEGYWSALRPAWEPAILAMRPMTGTFADNALTHGVAGLATDACRIRSAGAEDLPGGGRWPANVFMDEEVSRIVDRQAGEPVSRFFYCPKVGGDERGELTHPTLKPLALTEYLARLLLPPEGPEPRRLVVPFAGVASEVLGGLRAGWDEVVGIELDPFYVADGEDRIHRWEVQEHGRPAVPDDLADLPLFAGLDSLGEAG